MRKLLHATSPLSLFAVSALLITLTTGCPSSQEPPSERPEEPAAAPEMSSEPSQFAPSATSPDAAATPAPLPSTEPATIAPGTQPPAAQPPSMDIVPPDTQPPLAMPDDEQPLAPVPNGGSSEPPSDSSLPARNPLRDSAPPTDDQNHGGQNQSTPSQETSTPGHTDANPRRHPGHKDETFDPIKENGPIFVDWTKPAVALVISGRQDGYIEPCGCAGLDRMKGGMSRRHTLFEQLRKQQGWNVVGLDVGGIARGFGRQSELKFQIMVDGMREMGYDAVAFGTTDLKLPAAELLSAAVNGPTNESLFLGANVAMFGFQDGWYSPLRIVDVGGKKLGITSVLGKKEAAEINNVELETADPVKMLTEVLPKLKQQKPDYLILLAHASMDETKALAEQFPEFNIVVTAGGAPLPPAKPETLNGGKTLLIEVGEKGMDAVVVGLYDNQQPSFRYQRVPLDSRFPASTIMQRLLEAYQDQLKVEGFAGLGIPVGPQAPPHPKLEVGGKFVGSKKCESCHEPSYEIWKKSGHSRAYRTLAELKPARNFDPECISCHVVGWHPTKYFPYQTGFESLEKTPELIDTGCENCHGPGSKHVAAELRGDDDAVLEQLRKAMVITKEDSKKWQCITCHDGDNSPEFNFDTYWPLVEHYENSDE